MMTSEWGSSVDAVNGKPLGQAAETKCVRV